jgi:hypothetical protein
MPDSMVPGLPTDPDATPEPEPKDAVSAKIDNKDVAKVLKTKAEKSKKNRRAYTSEWKDNVNLRLGTSGVSIYTGGLRVAGAEGRTEINPDWSLTKTKTANLYSQVPSVQVTHENKQYAAAVPPFAKALNYELSEKRSNVGVAMEEVLNDVVNAAGVGAILVSYLARFEPVPLPAADPMLPAPPTLGGAPPSAMPPHPAAPPMMGAPGTLPPAAPAAPPPSPMGGAMPPKPGAPPPMSGPPTPGTPPGPVAPPPTPLGPEMLNAQRVVSDLFPVTRLSVTALLWPAEFIGSNFDDGDWVGHEGTATWAHGVNEWKLTDEDKDEVLIGGETASQDDLREAGDRTTQSESRRIKFTQLWYWRARVDPDEKQLSAIWELVYVEGKDDPVVHGPWKGQKLVEIPGKAARYIGACRFPLRFLTLTYITDNPIPPSDTAAGRSQVNDLRRSRGQMFMNRERSIPIRWFNTDRVDPLIQENLMRGTWQGMIPLQGDGTRSIGEIARASYPSEDFAFDQTAKQDLLESWQIGPNQMGLPAPGRQTKAQSDTTQQNFATRIGQERGKVATFFLGIADVLAGLMVLYSDFPSLSDQERQAMQGSWDLKHILHEFVLKVRPDSTLLLDSQARIQRLMQFINMTAKSGYVNIKPIITEIAELSGLDPSEVVVDPPPPVEKPNFSYRASGKDDLINPVVLAMLIKGKMAPSKDEIDQAKQLLMGAQMPAMPEAPVGPGGPGAPPGGPPASHPAEGVGEAHPDHQLMPKVAKRSRDISGG